MVKCECNHHFIMKAFGRKKMEFEKIKAIIADKMDLDPDTITEQSSFKDL